VCLSLGLKRRTDKLTAVEPSLREPKQRKKREIDDMKKSGCRGSLSEMNADGILSNRLKKGHFAREGKGVAKGKSLAARCERRGTCEMTKGPSMKRREERDQRKERAMKERGTVSRF